MSGNKVIILGNDHTNSLGVAQSLGCAGFRVIASVWGRRSGLLAASKYVNDIISGASPQACIDKIVAQVGEEGYPIPIIATCDGAAVALEENHDVLSPRFVFEHAKGTYTISQLSVKELQVTLAEQCGFNVPKSQMINSIDELAAKVTFSPPYLIKSLVSMEGSKNDLIICNSPEELQKQATIVLGRTPRILVQQYIEHDYEISILGCGLKNGGCVTPAIENKLTLYPKNVGLVCLAYVEEFQDCGIKESIHKLVETIGYVGLFSVEMMHCKKDGKFYFTEINLRNDGANAFIQKYGINLPATHVRDLLGQKQEHVTQLTPNYYIWEMHHFLSLLHREISLWQWLRELRKSRGFLTYRKEDKRPFYKQFSNYFLAKLHLRREKSYE